MACDEPAAAWACLSIWRRGFAACCDNALGRRSAPRLRPPIKERRFSGSRDSASQQQRFGNPRSRLRLRRRTSLSVFLHLRILSAGFAGPTALPPAVCFVLERRRPNLGALIYCSAFLSSSLLTRGVRSACDAARCSTTPRWRHVISRSSVECDPRSDAPAFPSPPRLPTFRRLRR